MYVKVYIAIFIPLLTQFSYIKVLYTFVQKCFFEIVDYIISQITVAQHMKLTS